jgi:hypothetical protein
MEKDNGEQTLKFNMTKKRKKVTPKVVEAFNKITDEFLCKLSANIYDIEFLKFKIRDLETKTTLFEI